MDIAKIKKTLSDFASALIQRRGDKNTFAYSLDDKYAFIVFPYRSYLNISSEKDEIFDDLEKIPEFNGKNILLISGNDFSNGRDRWFSRSDL